MEVRIIIASMELEPLIRSDVKADPIVLSLANFTIFIEGLSRNASAWVATPLAYYNDDSHI